MTDAPPPEAGALDFTPEEASDGFALPALLPAEGGVPQPEVLDAVFTSGALLMETIPAERLAEEPTLPGRLVQFGALLSASWLLPRPRRRRRPNPEKEDRS
jgi:hypothetical protein